jgi:hypothetical protein
MLNRLWVPLVLLFLFIVSSIHAQLSPSGGSAVQILDLGGTNKLAVNASGQIGLSNFPASFSVSNFPSSFNIGSALPAGTNVIGTVNTIPKTACGNTVASQALVAVPTSATAVFASTTCVVIIVLNNTNAAATSITVSDNQGTPVNDTLTFSIPGNSQLVQKLEGIAFTSGIKWSASGTGVTGGILGYQ